MKEPENLYRFGAVKKIFSYKILEKFLKSLEDWGLSNFSIGLIRFTK